MPPKDDTYKKKFNILLNPEMDDMLNDLAGAQDLSKSHLCRTLIKAAWGMRLGQRPACADGTACRCPHAHVYSPALPQPGPSDGPPDARG